jgi:hypothetical protein
MEKSEQNIITEEPIDDNKEIELLNRNKIDVDIEPDVKSNNVNLQMCNCTFIFKCFSPDKDKQQS